MAAREARALRAARETRGASPEDGDGLGLVGGQLVNEGLRLRAGRRAHVQRTIR